MVDGVLLEQIRLVAKLLILGQPILRDRTRPVRHQTISSSIDGKLEPRIAQRLVDGFGRRVWHRIISPPELPPGASFEWANAPDRSRPESASGSSNRWRPPCPL